MGHEVNPRPEFSCFSKVKSLLNPTIPCRSRAGIKEAAYLVHESGNTA
jgi:hypothetical protein